MKLLVSAIVLLTACVSGYTLTGSFVKFGRVSDIGGIYFGNGTGLPADGNFTVTCKSQQA